MVNRKNKFQVLYWIVHFCAHTKFSGEKLNINDFGLCQTTVLTLSFPLNMAISGMIITSQNSTDVLQKSNSIPM